MQRGLERVGVLIMHTNCPYSNATKTLGTKPFLDIYNDIPN